MLGLQAKKMAISNQRVRLADIQGFDIYRRAGVFLESQAMKKAVFATVLIAAAGAASGERVRTAHLAPCATCLPTASLLICATPAMSAGADRV